MRHSRFKAMFDSLVYTFTESTFLFECISFFVIIVAFGKSSRFRLLFRHSFRRSLYADWEVLNKMFKRTNFY